MTHFIGLILLALACLLLADRIEAVEPAEISKLTSTLDFVYINANTGEAAGGHTAIRLGSTVFHFQFFPDGRFLLVRESWSHFRYIYNELRNRSIFISRIALTPQVYTQLRNHFTSLLMTQQQNLSHLQAIENEKDLLQQLNSGTRQLALEAVGLFDYKSTKDAGIQDLNQIIQEELGKKFLIHQHKQAEIKLTKHALEADQPGTGLTWIAKLRVLLLEREFYRIMEKDMSLASDSVLTTSIENQSLTSEQRKTLEKYSKQLAASVVGLMQSQRSDRAESLLLQTARYLIINRSLATNTLLTLDPFSSRANVVQVPENDKLQGLHVQLQQNAAQAKKDFFKATANLNIAYTILESSLGRLYEIEHALDNGTSIRVEPGMLLPSRSGMVSLDFSYTQTWLPTLLAENQIKQLQLQQQVDKQYTYNLITQNCATELMRALNSAFVNKHVGQGEIGGWIEPDQDLIFIPNQFYTQIAEHFSVQAKEIHPSRRLRQADALYEHGNVSQLWLRESNIFSSTLYTHRTKDTYFLFFTDDALLLRPILGITNLLWGAANSVVGVFSLPVDSGERLHQSLRGMFYSLPELMFGNIRKGTYGFAETVTAGP